jgi:hypothetical protein
LEKRRVALRSRKAAQFLGLREVGVDFVEKECGLVLGDKAEHV